MSSSRIVAFAGKRIVGSLFTIYLIMTILFIIYNSVPGGDVVTRMYGLAPKEVQDEIRELWGLNEPLSEQYIIFIRNVFTLNYRMYGDQENTALDLLLPLLPYTLLLFGLSTILSYVIGTFVGIFVISRRKWYLEKMVVGFSIVLYTIPVFVLAIVCRTWLVFRYQIFPPVNIDVAFGATGLVKDLGEITVAVPAMILPLMILVSVGLARPLLLIREQIATLAGEPFVTTARAKGLTEYKVLSKHVARCALLPLLNDAAVNMALILSGGIVIEYIFSWPGIGSALFYALKYMYSPTITCAVFLLTVALLVAVFAADIITAYLDPRVT